MNLKCITINTHGLKDFRKRQTIFQWVKNQKHDVVFLQETHLSSADLDQLKQDWDGQVFLSPGNNHSAGVCTLFTRRTNFKVISESHDLAGRYLNLICDFGEANIQFCNIYAPNHVSQRKEFFESLHAILKGGIPTVFGGDFNCIEDSFLDKNGGDSDLAITALKALQLLNLTYDLKDVFRHLNPSTRNFTWTNPDGSISCRLDKFYVSGDIFRNCSYSNIVFFPYSDHDAPSISFRLPNSLKKGPGVWKFNTSLLDNPVFVDKIKSFWSHWQLRKIDFRDINAWWDIGKRKIKHIAMKLSKRLARERRQKRARLEQKLRDLSALKPSRPVLDAIEALKSDITDLDNTLVHGARIRSKERFYTEFEKPSKYFYSLENSRQSSKVISALKCNGRTVTSTQDILEKSAEFYENLYTAENPDLAAQDFLLSQIEKRLSPEERDSLEIKLDSQSCYDALSSMKEQKSPGSDGLPSEFYKTLWQIHCKTTCFASSKMVKP